MSESALQFTLRELRDFYSQPRVLIGMGAVALILGVSGPFQTFDQLLLVPRIAYWLAMTVTTFVAGCFFGYLATHLTGGWRHAQRLHFLIVGIAAGVPVTLVASTINWLVFGTFGAGTIGVLALGFYCVLISAAISLLFSLGRKTEAKPASEKVRLLQRLPAQKRGALISLSVADHYVEVVTGRGKELVLLRLSDAMAETAGVAGLQIHRSHWVAVDGIKGIKRAGGKVVVETMAGDQLPVSRSFLPALKERGLYA